jgi:patatin-like phospholipase/acyl hydrolase
LKEGSSIDTPRFARILSFDAGGVRCLSSLKLLEAILQEVHEQGKTAKVPKPCEYFDLIGGSEWGGVLALMLGRLRMVRILEESLLSMADALLYKEH